MARIKVSKNPNKPYCGTGVAGAGGFDEICKVFDPYEEVGAGLLGSLDQRLEHVNLVGKGQALLELTDHRLLELSPILHEDRGGNEVA